MVKKAKKNAENMSDSSNVNSGSNSDSDLDSDIGSSESANIKSSSDSSSQLTEKKNVQRPSDDNTNNESNDEDLKNKAEAITRENDSNKNDCNQAIASSVKQEIEKKKNKKIKKLNMKKVEDFNAKLRRRGVIYISHIPPQMGPNKVKTLLSSFGNITRVYLVPEDPSVRKRRQQQTGKKGGSKRYVEGWVEFEDRKIAKRVGMCLNNTPISNFKRSVHYGQMWNVKFLRKFQWSHLTEKVAYERRVKEHKLKIEMMQVKKENASYKQLVERGQTMDKIEARKKRKNSSAEGFDQKFKFRQREPMKDGETSAKSAVLDSLMKN